MKVSRTIARQVLEQRVAILGSDVPGSEELREIESLAASQVRSLLCVPLTVFEQVIGCIYLDSDSPRNRLNEEHLQLVTAIAGISAVALDSVRRLHWLEQENVRLTVEISQERSLVGEGERMKEVYQFLKRAGAHRFDRIDRGRERNWQGVGGAGLAPQQSAGEQAVHGHQLLCDSRDASGKRFVRPRAGSVYRSRFAEEGPA